MKNYFLKALLSFYILFSTLVYACGNNNNAIVQGPFKDNSFNKGYICFQNTVDKRDIHFYLSYSTKDGVHNDLIDTYEYSDAPVELMSVFFTSINREKNLIVLLRWNVNYASKSIQYPYYYEIKTYKKSGNRYELNLNPDKDRKLSGYQTIKNGRTIKYHLDNAEKIRFYFNNNYG